MHYFLYKITNKINNRFLIGKKSGNNKIIKLTYSSNPDLKKDIKIFGSINFDKEIIKEFKSKKELYNYYNKLKNNFIQNSLFYNKKYKIGKEGVENIKRGLKNRPNKMYPDFPGKIIIEDRYNFIIENYCKHENFKIKKTLFKKLYKTEKPIYCKECRSEILSDKNDRYLLSNLVHPKHYEENFISIYYPSLYKSILNIKFGNFKEKIYVYKNNIKFRPKCLLCNNDVSFCETKVKYNTYCNYHSELHKTSNNEIELYNFIKNIISPKEKIIQNYRKNNCEVDIYLPNLSIGFEFNGLYWHSEVFKDKKYHLDKKDFFKKNNIDLFYIWEDDWNDKKDIIKSIIKNKLGFSNKIYARNTKIKELKSSEVSDFLNKNHLQDKIAGSVNIGLFYNNNLISVMNFSKNRAGKEGWELLRFCSEINTIVVGGANKIFKHFIKEYNPNRIISYSDNDLFNGNLYKNLGFKYLGETGLGFWWSNNHKKYNRLNFQKWKLKDTEGKTGDEIMRNNGYHKIWNTGNSRWEYKLDI